MNTITNADALPMNTLKFDKQKKKKIEQAQNAYRFFLEQLLIFMIYSRVKGNTSENNEFIDNFITFANSLGKDEEQFKSLLKKTFEMINSNKNGFELLTFLEGEINNQNYRIQKERLDKLKDTIFTPGRYMNSEYCSYMMYYLNLDNQQLALSNLIKLSDETFKEKNLGGMFEECVEYHEYNIIDKHIFNENKFDKAVINILMKALFGIETEYEESFHKKLYSRKTIIDDNELNKTFSFPERLIEQMRRFGYEKTIGHLAYDAMLNQRSENHAEFEPDADRLNKKSNLRVISDIYASCKSGLFMKLNQVPKIIASIIEYDLRTTSDIALFYKYGSEVSFFKENIRIIGVGTNRCEITNQSNSQYTPLTSSKINEIENMVLALINNKRNADSHINKDDILDLIKDNKLVEGRLSETFIFEINRIIENKPILMHDTARVITGAVKNEIERKKIKDKIKSDLNLSDDQRDDVIDIVDKYHTERERNIFYMKATTTLISLYYSDSDFMNDWKDKKSMSHRFRSGDKVLHDYFKDNEKCIFRIMHEQAKKIRESDIKLPRNMVLNPIILPMMVI